MQSLLRRALASGGAPPGGGGVGRLRKLVVLFLGSSSSGRSSSAGQFQLRFRFGRLRPGKGKPPITIGDKNFTEEFVLGDLYAQALRAKGFTVNLKPNIGSSELTDKALTSGQIDMYPEYTGVILSVIAMQTTPAGHRRGHLRRRPRTTRTGRGFTLLDKTPFYDADAMATLKPFAKKHHLATMADLKKLPSFTQRRAAREQDPLRGHRRHAARPTRSTT